MADSLPVPGSSVAAAPLLAIAPSDVLRQVRRIELRTRRLLDSTFAGEYR
jgi:hypothetical protein